MKFETFHNGTKTAHSAAITYEIYTYTYKYIHPINFIKTHSGKSVRMKHGTQINDSSHEGI